MALKWDGGGGVKNLGGSGKCRKAEVAQYVVRLIWKKDFRVSKVR